MIDDKSVERKTLSSFFTNSNVYKIPSYQRKYVWNKSNIEKLFQDFQELILNEDSNETLYLGNILVKNEENEEKWLIDGQQRITTLLIFFKALYDDYLERTNDIDEKVTKKLESFIYMEEDIDKNLRLKVEDLINQDKFNLIFEKKLNIKNVSKKKMKKLNIFHKNYLIFRKMINEFFNRYGEFDIYSFLENFKKIWIIKIKLLKNDDELKIFETLNSRGTILEAVDSIKNFYFIYTDKMRKKGESINEILIKKTEYKIKTFFEKTLPETILWKKNEKEYSKEVKKLIKEYIIYRSLISNKDYELELPNESKPQDLYDKFKLVAEGEFNFLETNKNINNSINDLHKFLLMKKNIKDYLELNRNYHLEDFEISLMIFNKIFTGSQFFPILAQLMCKDNLSIEELEDFNMQEINDEFKKTVTFLEKLIVRRYITQKGTRLLTRTVNKIKVNSYDEVCKKFKGLLPNESEFIEGLRFNNIYETISSDVLKGVLWKIELSKYDVKSNENINYHNDKNKFTIEHILPQKINEKWKLRLGEKWDEIHQKYKNSLGNLTITSENSEMSNNDFNNKREHYLNSIIKMNREIAKYNNWSEKEIKNRTNELVNICLEIWN